MCCRIGICRKETAAVLFRECFVHIIGHWAVDDEYMTGLDTVEKDPILCGLVTKAYSQLCATLLDVNQTILLLSIRHPSIIKNGAFMDLDSNLLPAQNAKFYRSLKVEDANHQHEDWEQFATALSRLLGSNLVLDQSGFGAGDDEGLYNRSFLCAEISDEDLPWNPSEID
jgi:hypothetical protein